MKRTQIYITEEQHRKLTRKAKASGLTASELIREAIDEYLDPGSTRSKRLERFRAAARAAAGIAPYLPDGKEYVEQLRAIDVRRQEELERQWRGK